MKRYGKILMISLAVCLLFCSAAIPALALEESEVQQAIAEQGKEAVSGNIFIWFICAIAFLKISQKIDSFMSSLGISVGHTGGNMLGEAMIAIRTLGKFGASGKRGGGSSEAGSSEAKAAFYREGLWVRLADSSIVVQSTGQRQFPRMARSAVSQGRCSKAPCPVPATLRIA